MWALLGGAAWLLVLLLAVGGAIGWSFAVFLGALLSAGVACGWLIVAVTRGKGTPRAGRAGLLVALAVFVPVIFDPHTGDVFNLPKYTLVVLGALVLAGLWVVDAFHHRSVPRWRNGLQWVLAAVLVWTAVSALAGMDTHVGLLGDYGSYDGLYAALAFAVVTMVTAEAIDAGEIRKVLGAFAFAGASVVAIYGLIQLHDTEFGGSKWDFIHWNAASVVGNIFSTFGNPNHLAGYLAMVLPVAVVFGLGAKSRPPRLAGGLFSLTILALIVRSSARGAWVAVIASGVVLAAFLAPELRHRLAATVTAVGALVAVAVVGMIAGGKRFISEPLSALFQTGGHTSVQQRFDMWSAAAHIATNHPLAGVGPDSYALVFPQYQTAAWVAGLGPNYLVNGSHDIFMTVLADQGFVGLALFLALLAVVVLRSVGAWRRLRAVELEENGDPAVVERARSQRVTLAVVSASIAAYVVQAAFNVQQIGLSFVFWLLVGLLLVLAAAAGVPDSLRPDVLLSVEGRVSETPSGAPRRAMAARGRSRARGLGWWPTLLAAVAAIAVVIGLGLGADGPYRADHAYWAAIHLLAQTPANAAARASESADYFADIGHAQVLNPWEPRYPANEGVDVASSASYETSSARAVNDLSLGRSLFRKAEGEDSLWGEPYYDEAKLDVNLADIQPTQAVADLNAAVSAAGKALQDNPRDADYSKLLAQIEKERRSTR